MADSSSSLVLIYFPCRGRGLSLRLFLADSDADWENVTPQLKDWPQLKTTSQSGPFQTLPCLKFQENKDSKPLFLNETVGIAGFLAKKILPSSQIDESTYFLSLSIVSKVYTDLTSPLLALLWSPIRMPGLNTIAAISRLRTTSSAIFQNFEKNFLQDRREFLCETPFPTIADYFLFEALGAYLVILGDLLILPPSLVSFYDRMSKRKGIADFLEKDGNAAVVTKSPKEDEIRDLLVKHWNDSN